MKRASIVRMVVAACCLAAGSAAAQIPQGLSGPGGTVQFSPAPAMPAVGPSSNIYGAPSYGVPSVSRSGAIGIPVRGGHRHGGRASRAVRRQ